MQQQWPEGPNADPDAARERYKADMQASRGALRELLRVEMPVAHLGLAIAIIATIVAAVVWSPRTGAIIAGAFAGLFVIALAVGSWQAAEVGMRHAPPTGSPLAGRTGSRPDGVPHPCPTDGELAEIHGYQRATRMTNLRPMFLVRGLQPAWWAGDLHPR